MFYTNVFKLYLKADNDVRKASKDHWIKCHKANLESKNEDMIMFSAQILALYAVADEIIAEKVQ